MVHPLLSAVATILLTSVAFGPPEADLEARQVSLELGRWQALREAAWLEAPVVKPPGPWAASRSVLIERESDGVRIRATWQLETISAGWWTSPLIGPMPGMRVESARWRGREVGIARTPMGQEEVALEMAAESRGELELVVFVPAEGLPGGVDGNLDLWLLPASRGELRLADAPPEGRLPELVADGQARRAIAGRFWAGEAQLSLNWVDAPQASSDVEQPLAVAHAAVGLTFGDGEVRGRARVSWLLRRGRLDAVSIDTAGLGGDLEIAGPNVREWVRNGDRIDIELEAPVDGRIDVDLRWTQAISSEAATQLAAPRIAPGGVYRTEGFLQIARDGELEVLPKLAGWSAVAHAELPEWASGYIQGTATASFRRDGEDHGASFELLRFVPLSGPPVMVDVAAYEIATTDEGRSLVQVRYDVRNERASHLQIELPAGMRMLGVRVDGEAVTPSRDGASAWRIPLVRSLESVKGSLSFPVEVVCIGESDEWDKKEARELVLPAVDAPVAVSRVRLYLPPRYANRVDVGEHHRVESFSEGEGITYGLGVGVGSEAVARADELYRQALDRWMSNDFRGAQSSLDELAQLGASNKNIAGLQGNLDLIAGRDEPKRDDGEAGGGQSAVVSRRIKDQARTRASEDKQALVEKAKEAEKLEAQGAYDEAEEKLAEAQEIGDRLALLEQTESQEQSVYNQSLSPSSQRVREKKKRKLSRDFEATKTEEADAKSLPVGSSTSRDFTAVVETENAPAQGGESMPTTPAVANPNAALEAPVAVASAISVHVPAVGEAVLYQYMLLPEGKAPSVHLEARRHKQPKPKSKK